MIPLVLRSSLLVLRIFLVILIALGMARCTPAEQPLDLMSLPDRSRALIQVGDYQMTVEVVNSPESVTLGLSGRDEIGADGMLFVLPERSVARFWMKDMRFDLDMVWIDNWRIIGVTQRVPAPAEGTATKSLPIYPSPEKVTAVLEVPAGYAQEHGLETDDVIVGVRIVE